MRQMRPKRDLRQELAEGMTAFEARGGKVTRVDPPKQRR